MGNYKSYTEHGGDIYTEGRLKGVKLTDFSSNINFLGVPGSFADNYHKALEDIICYPDIKYREAKFHIKEYLKEGIGEENIIIGNGAAEIISLAVRALKKPCIVVPSFSEYESNAENHCEEVIFSYLNEDLSCNYHDILEKLKYCDSLVIANPNNPNGGVIDKGSFGEIMDYCEGHKKRIIIDEAFIEFVKDDRQSFIEQCKSFKCLFIIRALTKFFAMPGIRLGYGVSSDIDFIQSLSRFQIPWNINTFAEIAIKTVLKDREYINTSKAVIEAERQYFSQRLEEFEFIDKVYESQANFLLIKLGEFSGETLYNYCILQDTLIRKCGNFRGLDDRYLRLAVKNREDNNKLLAIFKNFERDKR